jgi:7-cyano-7-deazaguanine synthase
VSANARRSTAQRTATRHPAHIDRRDASIRNCPRKLAGMLQSALVLLSGGQDSATCLAWALSRFARVETIGFEYAGQRQVEVEARLGFIAALRERFPDWSARLGADHRVAMPEMARLAATALAPEAAARMAAKGLPETFVPGRNLLFFTYAAALAYRRDIGALVGGMCETDYSAYPDGRDETLRALQQALALGMDQALAIETPLMWLDKAATWRMAHDLGGEALVQLIREQTSSCYLGERSKLFEWGRGCGLCPGCGLRASGWQAWQATLAAPVHG